MSPPTPGTFAWNELASADPERARRFYADVFGWTYESFRLPGGDYWVVRHEDRMVGGIGGLDAGPQGTVASTWVCWIAVADVDQATTVASDAGGSVVELPHDVPGVGRVAVIRDPTGAIVGLLQGAG